MLRSWKSGLGAVAVLALVAGGGCKRTPETPDLTGDGGEDTGGDDEATSSAATSTTGGADGSSGTEGADAPKYDVGGIPDAPTFPNNCEGGDGNGGGNGGPQFSYIWVANSSEGTVSKIDTVTLEEVGRYKTHPSYGDPSRTSVSLNGDVAVANRNGNGSIDTSTGKNDVLEWDDEECRAWFTPFDYESQRPVAWTPGQWSSSQCRYVDTKVWTSGTNGGFGGGMGGGKPFPGEDGGEEPPPPGGGVDVILVDGETGEVEHAVKIPEVIPDYFGLYGGAVDGDVGVSTKRRTNHRFGGVCVGVSDVVGGEKVKG